jgi:hypothetical protein
MHQGTLPLEGLLTFLNFCRARNFEQYKMSWDSYIDNLVAQTKDASGTAHVDKACIIGLDGGAAWTTAGHACALKVCI